MTIVPFILLTVIVVVLIKAAISIKKESSEMRKKIYGAEDNESIKQQWRRSVQQQQPLSSKIKHSSL